MGKELGIDSSSTFFFFITNSSSTSALDPRLSHSPFSQTLKPDSIDKQNICEKRRKAIYSYLLVTVVHDCGAEKGGEVVAQSTCVRGVRCHDTNRGDVTINKKSKI